MARRVRDQIADVAKQVSLWVIRQNELLTSPVVFNLERTRALEFFTDKQRNRSSKSRA